MAQPTISRNTAILINTNIMLGTGVFINTAKLAQATGVLSPLVYACVGALLYPLIHVFIQLQRYMPRGSLYDFGAIIHPRIGFISAWGYYVGKLASAYLGIHVFSHILEQIVPSIPTHITECILIIMCIWLYQQRIQVTTSVQYAFMACKLIPLLSVIFLGLCWITSEQLVISLPAVWSNFPAAIPFVLFSFAGFEASCSLSQSLPDPHREAPRVIILSYILAVGISILYQATSWILLGNALAEAPSYIHAFTTILYTTLPVNAIAFVHILALTTIAISALGASYSIIFSNTWNLYILAKKRHLRGASLLSRTNRYDMPSLCALVTGGILFSYFVWTGGDATPLQQLGAAGATWTYTFSIIAWIYHTQASFISILALASSSIFIWATVQSGITFGVTAYLVFLSLLLLGYVLYTGTENNSKIE